MNTSELTENAFVLRSMADQFTHQRDVNFVIECADTLLSLASERDAAQAEAAALRAEIEKARDMFNRDAEARRKASHGTNASHFPVIKAKADSGYRAYSVCAAVLDGILAPVEAL